MKNVKILLTILLVSLLMVGCNAKVVEPGKDAETPSVEENKDTTETEKNDDKETDENKSEDNADGKKIIPAPDFTTVDLEGNEVKLSDFKGKYVFLNFWATWCTYCKEEMPAIQKTFEEYEIDKQEVVFLIVNVGETKETIQTYLDGSETKYSFKILMDENKEIASMYNISAFPTSFYIDQEGNVLGYVPGAMKEEDMKKNMELMTKGKVEKEQ